MGIEDQVSSNPRGLDEKSILLSSNNSKGDETFRHLNTIVKFEFYTFNLRTTDTKKRGEVDNVGNKIVQNREDVIFEENLNGDRETEVIVTEQSQETEENTPYNVVEW